MKSEALTLGGGAGAAGETAEGDPGVAAEAGAHAATHAMKQSVLESIIRLGEIILEAIRALQSL